jgi:hypothetical protein
MDVKEIAFGTAAGDGLPVLLLLLLMHKLLLLLLLCKLLLLLVKLLPGTLGFGFVGGSLEDLS